MKSFAKLVSLTMQSALFYRSAFLLSMITPLILLGGQFMLWHSLYVTGSGEIGGFSSKDMYAYILISFFINNLLTWSTENMLSREIRSGKVVSRCLKPVSFLSQSLADMTGYVIPQALVNGIVTAVIFILFSKSIALPDDAMLPAAICSLALGLLLRMLMVGCASLLCFFTTSHLGLSWVRTALMDFFSGALIPVALFPGWLKTVAWMTPFPLMVQTPAALFLKQTLYLPVWATILMQLAWAAVFFFIHQALYEKVRRTVSFAGG
jgi:ABC-2 type transport system permease protein